MSPKLTACEETERHLESLLRGNRRPHDGVLLLNVGSNSISKTLENLGRHPQVSAKLVRVFQEVPCERMVRSGLLALLNIRLDPRSRFLGRAFVLAKQKN